MEVYTWSPGSDLTLDKLFEEAREEQYRTMEHRLKENYSRHSFEYSGIVANTMTINSSGDPEICSTISNRPCWPTNAYRILNRLWKHTNKVTHSKFISEAMFLNVSSQAKWLKSNTDCDLYFISRQTGNWMGWVARKFLDQYKINFSVAKNKYLTCPNECDESCWQHIIYIGKDSILKEWKCK